MAFESIERRRDILRSMEFEAGRLQAKPARRCLNLAHLQHGGGIAGIGHDRQLPEIGDNLAQQFESFGGSVSLLKRQAGDVAAGLGQARN